MDANKKDTLLQNFFEVTNSLLNPSIRNWREQGGKVVGYYCAFLPEEIFTAAGLLPFRMRATGSIGTELSDAYFGSTNCSFPRHSFNIALQGGYDFIDGVVFLNTCDHVRRLYDNWKRFVKHPFLHLVSLPRKAGEPQVQWYRDELLNLKENLEKHFGMEITNERLWQAIKLHNETRRLQRKVYELRKLENPPITGAETLAITVAGTAMPKELYNKLLEDLLNEISQSEGTTVYRARLMIVGGILDNPAFVSVIEDQGGLVVTDALCFGSKILWEDVYEEEGDPLMALSRYQLVHRPSCPRIFGTYTKRVDLIKEMIREFKVDGVIIEQQMYCDLWSGEQMMLRRQFKNMGIPFLSLSREYPLSGVGQLRTRVQAFLETLEQDWGK